jgi:hypothetical protein
MNLTQLERIKTDQKHGFYEKNKIGGPRCDYQKISGAIREVSQDTSNSAHEKNKLLG